MLDFYENDEKYFHWKTSSRTVLLLKQVSSGMSTGSFCLHIGLQWVEFQLFDDLILEEQKFGRKIFSWKSFAEQFFAEKACWWASSIQQVGRK